MKYQSLPIKYQRRASNPDRTKQRCDDFEKGWKEKSRQRGTALPPWTHADKELAYAPTSKYDQVPVVGA